MNDLSGRYAALTHRLVNSVLAALGRTPSELRLAVLARAARLDPTPGEEDLPPALAAYLDKVALHAYKVTDEDLATLQRAGNSDGALFELTVAAALGAALGRLERGLAAVRGEEEPVSSPPEPLSTSWIVLSSPPDPLSTSWRGATEEPH